jgi:hypothetical protein
MRLVQEKEIENREKHGFYSLYLSPEVNTPLIKNEYRLSVEFSIRDFRGLCNFNSMFFKKNFRGVY